MNLKDAAANLNQAHPEDTLHPPLYSLGGITDAIRFL